MEKMRGPFQGVWNIIRFNWHFYVWVVCLISLMCLLLIIVPVSFQSYVLIAVILTLLTVFNSILVSYYIYDLSGLYKLPWLTDQTNDEVQNMLNINAGFDETSQLLHTRFPAANLDIADFYDSSKHTEPSIRRARKSYPPFPGTVTVNSYHLPFKDGVYDAVFAILSAHEIRNMEERITFFKELNRITNEEGLVYVTEHLRDLPNFLAYTIGFFHFHSHVTWNKTFQQAGSQVKKEIRFTPFITTFILCKI